MHFAIGSGRARIPVGYLAWLEERRLMPMLTLDAIAEKRSERHKAAADFRVRYSAILSEVRKRSIFLCVSVKSSKDKDGNTVIESIKGPTLNRDEVVIDLLAKWKAKVKLSASLGETKIIRGLYPDRDFACCRVNVVFTWRFVDKEEQVVLSADEFFAIGRHKPTVQAVHLFDGDKSVPYWFDMAEREYYYYDPQSRRYYCRSDARRMEADENATEERSG